MGGEGLDDDFAFEFTASGTSGDLGDELEGALAGAEIGDVEAEVGVEDSDEGDVGEMQALGDHLGADKDVDFLGFEFPEDVFEGVFAAHGIGIDAGEAGFGEDFLEDFLDLLGAVSLEGDAGIFALRTFPWDDGLVAADVADEALIGAVVGEGDGAVRALADMAAAVALQGAGEAAAVEEKDGLLAFFEALFEGGAEAVGEDGDLAFLLLLFQTHVDDADERHGVGVGAFVEAEELVFSGEGVLPAFERRRGGAENDGAGLEGGAEDGDVAGLVAGDVFLLVGGFVLLIDDDEAEIRQGCEDGGAGADHDACRAFADAVPLVESLALREVGVEDGDLVGEVGETCLEAADGLGGEGDFRDEDEDGFSEVQGGLGGLEIDFGFAGAGDAEKKNGFTVQCRVPSDQ